MLGSFALRSSPAPPVALALDPGGGNGGADLWRRVSSPSSASWTRLMPLVRQPSSSSSVVCGAQRSNSSIPKLEPFSRSRIDRLVKDPPFLQKCENDLTDYCSTLEGDHAYSCWRAYFELKDLEKELPREDVEKFVRQAGGIKSLIDCLHGLTAMEAKKREVQEHKTSRSETQKERPFPTPDGLPKTEEELEEEEKARMPDSPFTRLLRSKGRLPAWYTQAPDHETD